MHRGYKRGSKQTQRERKMRREIKGKQESHEIWRRRAEGEKEGVGEINREGCSKIEM